MPALCSPLNGVWVAGQPAVAASAAPDAGGAPPLLGVTVRRQEPLPLRFSRRMDDLPLSAREGEACLLLLAGHSRPAIAEKLGVSQHTAIAHCRNVYDKLDVRNRAELAAKVLSK